MLCISSTSILLTALAAFDLVPGVLGHNFVKCVNSRPNLTNLLTRKGDYDADLDPCDGYPRALVANTSSQYSLVGDQGYPWQFIWPTMDGIAFKNHRACNWLQENPVYDPTHPWTTVKTGATIMVEVQTNNHAHEYAERPSGHYKVYLAGKAGTQITTINQLTDDRVIFKAPANKYAHIIGTPNFGGYGGDPGASWLPLKLVDPTGASLPPGVYNFVWTYWWATGEKPETDYMLPSYSSCFDVEIRDDAEDPGFLTDAVNADPNYHVTLIGNSSSPGSLDHTSPWPPYSNNYLDKGYDGGDPAQPDGSRTFKPYWASHIDALPMDAPSLKTIGSIKDWTADALASALPLPPGSSAIWPTDNTEVGNMSAGSGDGGMTPSAITPLSIAGATQSNLTTTGGTGNFTDGVSGSYDAGAAGTNTTGTVDATGADGGVGGSNSTDEYDCSGPPKKGSNSTTIASSTVSSTTLAASSSSTPIAVFADGAASPTPPASPTVSPDALPTPDGLDDDIPCDGNMPVSPDALPTPDVLEDDIPCDGNMTMHKHKHNNHHHGGGRPHDQSSGAAEPTGRYRRRGGYYV